MSFRIGDLVIVNTNNEQPYVNKGDVGIIVTIYLNRKDEPMVPTIAQVSMSDGSYKKLDTKSLDKASEWGF